MSGDLSEHFSKHEFACPCGCGFDVPQKYHVRHLEILRDMVCERMGKDWPVVLTTAMGKSGGNRCKVWNKRAGGAAGSRHMHGDASDIYVPGMTPKELARLCEKVGRIKGNPRLVDGFGGIGVGSHVVHVDSRPRKPDGTRAHWTYGDVKFAWAKDLSNGGY